MPTPTHLILVCCHGIYLPSSPTAGLAPSEWLLAPFQTGEIPTLTAHIQTGLRLLAGDPRALLVFSGAATRKETRCSEAQSYWDLCVENGFWGILGDREGGRDRDGNGDRNEEWRKKERERERVLIEEQALDSWGNLIFSLLRFWRAAQRWPERITVVSMGFKRRRFEDVHFRVLRWPAGRVAFVGVDPGYMVEGREEFDGERAEEVRKGERERGLRAWEGDPEGVGEVLRGKRVGRNVWGVGQRWFAEGEEEERGRSGVRTRVRSGDGVVEEVLGEGRQPWEVVEEGN